MTHYYLLSEGFVSQIVIVMNFVIVSSVGIKTVVCNSIFIAECKAQAKRQEGAGTRADGKTMSRTVSVLISQARQGQIKMDKNGKKQS